MSESITLTIPLYRGLKSQTIDAIKVTAHFAVHPSLDVVVIKNIEDRQATPWTITHIPTLSRVVFSDSQVHAEQVAQMLEALPINWNITDRIEKKDKANRQLIMAICRRLAAEGLCWSEWV